MMEHIIEYTTTEENQEIKLFQNFKPIAYCEDLDSGEIIKLERTYPDVDKKLGLYRTYEHAGIHRIMFKWKPYTTDISYVFANQAVTGGGEIQNAL